VAVHPDDDRYRALIGQRVRLPLTDRTLPIIADEYVKPEFGSGALKITPGHDPNDFEIGNRHGLERISVIGEDGRMIAPAPERFVGRPVLEARETVVAELREAGLLSASEPLTHTVPYSHRSGERIEPLVSLQWFMRMEELAAPAIAAVRDGRIRITPDSERRRYLDWLENIRPWCISRQLWWGHQIPVWYRTHPVPETYVGLEPPEGDGWERDPDVLDTWFSSALWPFATLGWPHATPALRAFYPTDVLSTARDIIFLWVARMVMMGLEFTEEIPFANVNVHSIIQAPDGRRMSKSLGTGIDPMALIEGGERPPVFAGGGEFPAYGADAVRWGLLAMSSGQDVRFAEDKVAQGQGLTNKLWNASRLVLLGVDPQARAALDPGAVEDRWILSRLARARAEIDERLERFEFSRAALSLYDFVYGELCDWYLELVKPRLRAADPQAQATLLLVLRGTLVLAHPLIPFVTEEIWSHLPDADGLLAAGPGAGTDVGAPAVDEAAEADVARLIEAVGALRAWRDSAEVKAGAALSARVVAPGFDGALGEHLVRLGRLDVGAGGAQAQVAVAVPVPGGTIEILTSDALDLDAAARRVAAERERLLAEIDRAGRKLDNQGFVAKAPPEVVDAERAKLERLRRELDALGA
jgi:valyl-tRNA synthetase